MPFEGATNQVKLPNLCKEPINHNNYASECKWRTTDLAWLQIPIAATQVTCLQLGDLQFRTAVFAANLENKDLPDI